MLRYMFLSEFSQFMLLFTGGGGGGRQDKTHPPRYLHWANWRCEAALE